MDRTAFIEAAKSKPVMRIDLLKDDVFFIRPSLCDASEIVVVFPDEVYRITSKEIAEDQHGFAIRKLKNYDNDEAALQITAWEEQDIRCIGMKKEDNDIFLLFKVDDAYLLITPLHGLMMVGFTGSDESGNFCEPKREVLFKGYEDV